MGSLLLKIRVQKTPVNFTVLSAIKRLARQAALQSEIISSSESVTIEKIARLIDLIIEGNKDSSNI